MEPYLQTFSAIDHVLRASRTKLHLVLCCGWRRATPGEAWLPAPEISTHRFWSVHIVCIVVGRLQFSPDGTLALLSVYIVCSRRLAGGRHRGSVLSLPVGTWKSRQGSNSYIGGTGSLAIQRRHFFEHSNSRDGRNVESRDDTSVAGCRKVKVLQCHASVACGEALLAVLTMLGGTRFDGREKGVFRNPGTICRFRLDFYLYIHGIYYFVIIRAIHSGSVLQ